MYIYKRMRTRGIVVKKHVDQVSSWLTVGGMQIPASHHVVRRLPSPHPYTSVSRQTASRRSIHIRNECRIANTNKGGTAMEGTPHGVTVTATFAVLLVSVTGITSARRATDIVCVHDVRGVHDGFGDLLDLLICRVTK